MAAPTAYNFQQELTAMVPGEARAQFYANMVGTLAIHVDLAIFLRCMRTALTFTMITDGARERLLKEIAEYERKAS